MPIKYLKQANEIQRICASAVLTPDQMASRAAVKPDSMRKIIKGYQPCSPQLMQAFRVIAENENLHRDALSADNSSGAVMKKKGGDKKRAPRYHGGPFWGTGDAVPIISWASAGMGAAYEDQGSNVPHIKSDCGDPNCYALTIAGDSMEPIYRAGDVVVVAPNSEAKSRDLVIVKTVEEDVYFKELRFSQDMQTVRLFSFNPNYPVMEFSRSQLRFIHPVHSMTRSFRSSPKL